MIVLIIFCSESYLLDEDTGFNYSTTTNNYFLTNQEQNTHASQVDLTDLNKRHTFCNATLTNLSD